MATSTEGPSGIKTWAPIVLGVLGLVFGSGILTNWWGWQHQDAVEVRRENLAQAAELLSYRNEHLGPIHSLVATNAAIYDDLQRQYLLPGWGAQESYFKLVRRDGEAAQSVMRARIDEIVANNRLVEEHLRQVSTRIMTEAFRRETRAFLERDELALIRFGIP